MSSALRIAYLLPDTTLFIQCKELSELDWSTWKDYDEIHLIVTRPVQKEIDKHKNTGNDRTARRARKAASRFHTIILSDTGYELTENHGQIIKTILVGHDPDPELKDKLDYSTSDNTLVGTVCAFAKEKGLNAFVRLLAHDTGPLMSAKAVGVPFVVIPDHWFLKSEPSEEEKKIAQLEQRVRQLEKTEPNVTLRCLDQSGDRLDDGTALELDVPYWVPLTEDQVAALTSRIKARLPMETNFEVPRVAPLLAHVMGYKTEYVPAKEDDIQAYRENQYPSWLAQCASTLRDFHKSMQARERVPRCTILGCNDGSRPAEDVLASIEAKGSFRILRAKQVNTKTKLRAVSLSPPPKPPRGKYVVQSIADLLAASSFPEPTFLHELTTGIDRYPVPDFHLDPFLKGGPLNTDPNTFYFVSKKGENKFLEWECSQWRHGEDSYQPFKLAILSKPGVSVNGLLECKIQAANLSVAAVCKVPIRITSQEVSAYKRANELVDQFVAGVIPRRGGKLSVRSR